MITYLSSLITAILPPNRTYQLFNQSQSIRISSSGLRACMHSLSQRRLLVPALIACPSAAGQSRAPPRMHSACDFHFWTLSKNVQSRAAPRMHSAPRHANRIVRAAPRMHSAPEIPRGSAHAPRASSLNAAQLMTNDTGTADNSITATTIFDYYCRVLRRASTTPSKGAAGDRSEEHQW